MSRGRALARPFYSKIIFFQISNPPPLTEKLDPPLTIDWQNILSLITAIPALNISK